MASKTPQELAVEYGFAEGFFKADSELWNLFTKARKGKWSVSKFQAAFMNTSWYRSREASVRQWADLVIRDPAEARAKIAERQADLADRVSQLGLSLDAGTLNRLASDSLQWSWSEAQLNDTLSGYVQYKPGETSGGIAAIETNVRNLAWQYGVDVTDSQMQDWISGMVAQRYNEDALKDLITDMARSKYGGMKSYLDSGLTVRQVASNYLTEYGKLLEVNPDAVELDDPLVASALQGKIDPKTGQPQMQTVSQFRQAVKQDKRWLYTQNARDEMMGVGMGILQDMGLYS